MGSQAAYCVLLNKHAMNVNDYRWKCDLILDGNVVKQDCSFVHHYNKLCA